MDGAGVAGALVGAAVAYAVIKEADKHTRTHKGHGLFAQGHHSARHHMARHHQYKGHGLFEG